MLYNMARDKSRLSGYGVTLSSPLAHPRQRRTRAPTHNWHQRGRSPNDYSTTSEFSNRSSAWCMSRISSTDHVMPIVPTTVMITWKCEVAIANDSGASHITKAIVSITVEETRLQKNKVLRMMLSKKKGAEAPVDYSTSISTGCSCQITLRRLRWSLAIFKLTKCLAYCVASS
jgi:hypothetical protein